MQNFAVEKVHLDTHHTATSTNVVANFHSTTRQCAIRRAHIQWHTLQEVVDVAVVTVVVAVVVSVPVEVVTAEDAVGLEVVTVEDAVGSEVAEVSFAIGFQSLTLGFGLLFFCIIRCAKFTGNE